MDDLLTAAADKVRELGSARLAIVLGSGFGGAFEELTPLASKAYSEFPGFPTLSVPGHSGRLSAFSVGDVPIFVLSGRAHFYEGHSMETVTFPIRVLAKAGVTELLLTNAAGAIRADLRPGDLMRITDHINFMGVNPLRGAAAQKNDCFVDCTRVYDAHLGELLTAAAKECGLELKTGIYLAVSGPSYETPAEIDAFERLGADVVGMSTVPEAIVARHCGLRVAGLSCITNFAAGRSKGLLSHAEVISEGERMKHKAARLLKAFVHFYGAHR